MDSNQELDNLIELVSNVTDAHTAALFWLDDGKERLHLKVFYSLSRNLCPQISIELGQGLVGWVAKNAKSVNVAKFDRDPRTLQYYTSEENIKSFVAVPVKNNGKLVGVLSIDSKRNYQYTNKHQKILAGFAVQFSHLVERQSQESGGQVQGSNRLYQLCNQIASSAWQDVFNVSLEVSQETLKFDNYVMALYNEDKNELLLKLVYGDCSEYQDRWLPAGSGLAGLILKQKKPLLLDNLSKRESKQFVFGRQGPKFEMDSFLGLPLICGGRVRGLQAYTSRKPSAFSRQDEESAAIIAMQVAALTSQWQMHHVKDSWRRFDNVSGLLSHGSFLQKLQERLQTANSRHPLSLLLVSIDRLDSINREFGYETGDEILRRVARILLNVVPDKESVGRFGGRKFSLSLENTKPNAAEEVARRICNIIEHSRFKIGGLELTLTVSVGSACCPNDVGNWQQLVEYVQNALNQVETKRREVSN